MSRIVLLALLVSVAGCGFRFALGVNRYGGPLAPLVVRDLGGQEVGEVLRRHLPGALARAGLSRGSGAARQLTVVVESWHRLSLFNTLPTQTVLFGEKFLVTARVTIAGLQRAPFVITETIIMAPPSEVEGRATNLRRVAENIGRSLADRIAEVLE